MYSPGHTSVVMLVHSEHGSLAEKETPFPLPKSGKKMALGFEPRQLDSRVYPLATTPASPTPLELGICSVLWTWEQVLGKHPKFLAYNFHLLHPLCSSTQQQDWGGSSCHRGVPLQYATFILQVVSRSFLYGCNAAFLTLAYVGLVCAP